ncbi:hypothetical protein BDQ17DRAFT_1392769 [Cyathus striatus]|nr:hypothetical protein BDQ17DRAFT_1392769 [Cyathus striatus]
MSYLASSPRPFDSQGQQDLTQSLSSHVQRQQQHQIPLPVYPTYPSTHQSISTSPSTSQISSYATDQSSSNLPKVGQTRCYWALLTSDLVFIYLDPVLASHLEEQAPNLIGKPLLSFVHPDEQASAKQDLGGVLESRTLHGSVTRVRFSRLSRVRRQLGYVGPPAPWTDADKVAVDSNYMAVDIVINWAAEGLVLCFIHAIVDLDPGDNDEHHKTEWTNWCGTPIMSQHEIELLFGRLMSCAPRSATLSRVFQILGHEQSRPLLLSWPPDLGTGPTGRDFAKLVENVQIGNGMPNGTDAKTSCTRRYKALQNMPSIVGGQVESIFIPHGSIIFACHKVEAPSRSAVNSGATMQQLGYTTAMNYNAQNSSYYDQQGGSYALPPLSPTTTYNSAYMSQQAPQIQAPYSPQRWTQQVANPAAGVSNIRSVSYFPPLPQPTQQWQPTPYVDTSASQAGYARPLSPTYTYSPTTPATTTGGSAATSPTADVVPPPRRRVSPGSTRDQYAGSGRNASNRPTGVLKCSSCKATTSPEWRKGPSGKKELCNACGLRYARSRAKKEGHSQAQRRRKDKGITKRESATPPTSASPSYSAVRRSYGESSFSTSSAGSASGSDIYSHSGHPILDNSTPSPSPPASNMNFVHYTPAGDNRPPYSSSTSTFYSAPSPLSNSTLLQEQQAPTTQLPPLGQISAYVDRVPSMVQSASPISHSPLTSTFPAASFERERERDRDPRELPSTPLTAEPRHSRRSILSQQ